MKTTRTQTGWTGVVATLIQLFGQLDPKRGLEMGKKAGFRAAAVPKEG